MVEKDAAKSPESVSAARIAAEAAVVAEQHASDAFAAIKGALEDWQDAHGWPEKGDKNYNTELEDAKELAQKRHDAAILATNKAYANYIRVARYGSKS